MRSNVNLCSAIDSSKRLQNWEIRLKEPDTPINRLNVKKRRKGMEAKDAALPFVFSILLDYVTTSYNLKSAETPRKVG